MDFRILIVEDEARLREVVCDYFRSRGDTPFEAENGLRALELIEDAEFDAVLLDIMMPELDGLSVCRALRRDNDVPIILLTALSDEEDKLLGYELGADDYVTKPFSLSVLYAKTAALIKRSRRQVLTGGRMEAGGIVLEDSTRRVWAGGRSLPTGAELRSGSIVTSILPTPIVPGRKAQTKTSMVCSGSFIPKAETSPALLLPH